MENNNDPLGLFQTNSAASDNDPLGLFKAPDTPKKEPGGFGASVKQTVGASIKGAGQAAADFIPGVEQDNAVKRYGQEVIDANPTAVHSLGDIKDKPLTAVKEATGNAAASVGEMVGIRALGQGITAAAPLAGPAAPVVAGVGQAISWLGPMAVAALPSFGGIRDKQILNDPAHQESAKSKAIAAMGAATVGLIETKFGPQNWALAAMTKEGRAELAKKFASTTLTGSIAKGAIKGGAVEGAEEMAQNPVEQVASFDDPTSKESLQDTAFSGAMGALGGTVLGGAGGSLAGERIKNSAAQTAEQEIPELPPENPPGQPSDGAFTDEEIAAFRAEQAQNQSMMARDGEIKSTMQEYHDNQVRVAKIYEARAARALQQAQTDYGIINAGEGAQKSAAQLNLERATLAHRNAVYAARDAEEARRQSFMPQNIAKVQLGTGSIGKAAAAGIDSGAIAPEQVTAAVQQPAAAKPSLSLAAALVPLSQRPKETNAQAAQTVTPETQSEAAAASTGVTPEGISPAAMLKLEVLTREARKSGKSEAKSHNLVQRIRQLDGVKKSEILDITGEDSQAEINLKGLFNENGLGLDDLATILKADGFPIDDADMDYDGGVTKLKELINTASGSPVLTYQAQEEKYARDAEYAHNIELRKQADELNIRHVGRKLADVSRDIELKLTAEINAKESALRDKLNALGEELDSAMTEAQSLLGDDGASESLMSAFEQIDAAGVTDEAEQLAIQKDAIFAAIERKKDENTRTGQAAATTPQGSDGTGGTEVAAQADQKSESSEGDAQTVVNAAIPEERHAQERLRLEDLETPTEDMDDEEVRASLIRLRLNVGSNPLTGLPSKAVWEAKQSSGRGKKFVASIDVDALKWFNDNIGHEIGGNVLLNRIGAALIDANIDAYHISGDEFYAMGDTQEQLENSLKEAQTVLSKTVIIGNNWHVTGVGFSYGIATDIGDAEHGLHTNKAQREAAGLRSSRGYAPRGAIKTDQSNEPSGTRKGDYGTALNQQGAGRGARETVNQTTREYSDPYDTLKTRTGTTQDQLNTGRQSLADVERRVFGRNRINLPEGTALLGSNIASDFRAKGYTSLVGRQARSSRDLAVIAQVLRDPRFETFRAFYVKDGRIVGERAYSSRMAGSVSLPNDIAEHISADMGRTGSDGYWLLHNHPSGKADASSGDILLTEHINATAKGMLGHVIIDHNEYNSIYLKDGLDGAKALENVIETDLGAISSFPEVPNKLLGSSINGPRDIAAIAKNLQQDGIYSSIIGRSARGEVVMVMDVPKMEVKTGIQKLRAAAMIRRAARETGATSVFAVVPGKLEEYKHLMDGMFMDVIEGDTGNSAVGSGIMASASIPATSAQGRGALIYVAEPKGKYATVDMFNTQGDMFEKQSSKPEFQIESQTNAEIAAKEARAQDTAIEDKAATDRAAEVPFTLSMQSQEKPAGAQAGMFTPDGRATVAAETSEANPAERAIWIPNMKPGKLDKLLAKEYLTANDIADIKDFKYFLINQKQDAYEKGFYDILKTSGQHDVAYVLKNKFLLTNIDAKLNSAKPSAEAAKAAFFAQPTSEATKAKKIEVLKEQAKGKITGDQGAALKELADAGEHAAVDAVLNPAAQQEFKPISQRNIKNAIEYKDLKSLLNATESVLSSPDSGGKFAAQSKSMWLYNAEYAAKENFGDTESILALRKKYAISRPQDLTGEVGGHSVFGIPLPTRSYEIGDNVPGVGEITDSVYLPDGYKQFQIGGEWYHETSVDASAKPSKPAQTEQPASAEAAPTRKPLNPDQAAIDKADADFDDALGDLGDIIGNNLRATLTPEQEQKLLPVLTKLFDAAFRKGYYKFKDAARFVLGAIKAKFGEDVTDQISIESLQGAYIGMSGRYKEQGADKARDVIAVESKDDIGESDVTDERSSTNLERDSQDAETENSMGAQGVRAGRGGNGRAGRSGVQGAAEAGGPRNGDGISGRETAAAGNDSNSEIYTGAAELSPGSAGNSVDQRSDSAGIEGAPIEPETTSITDELAESGLSLEKAKIKQLQADKKEHKPGIENIRTTLPILTEGQQEDVHTAETRFAQPDGYGMLFTNGTGTGKTFTGLGVIKRFVTAGKSNIIIAVPNDKIASDWQKSGKLLGLDISRLDDTKSAGKGVVITTYANFGQNNELASRDWDLVVTDEAHYLAMDKNGTNTLALHALRAITLHPAGASTRATMLHADLLSEMKSLDAQAKMMRTGDNQDEWYAAGPIQDKADKLRNKYHEHLDAIRAEVKAKQGAARPRTLFLSATPFAYEKTVDWANGYLFDYNEGKGDEGSESRGYNAGSNSDQFMMQHFGYRMRTGKLTQPDAKVDSGLMQRQFNSFLKKRGVLSGRMLDVKADYDRRFILVESAIGQRIDAALQWFEDQRKQDTQDKNPEGKLSIAMQANPRSEAISQLRDTIGKKFDYLSRRYLLEAIKAQEVIPHVKEHLALGRKVVVFHDYKKGGGFNPFDISNITETSDNGISAAEYNAVVDEFRDEFKDLIDSDVWRASSPITAFRQEFPGVLLFNGDIPAAQRRANVEKFQDDASGPQVFLVQSAAGKEGISLHDTTGKFQRVLFNLGQPTQPTTAIQQEGRIYRTGQVTDAIFRYLNTGTNWEKWAFATTIAQRASAAENLGMGELARALKDAFIAGFEESDNYRAGMEGEGKGGKERDKAANNALTEYDRARAFYFGTQKKNSRTKSQEGTDYFATPEPVGLKMVELADIRTGESMLEPSAGHGAIARWMPTTVEKTAVEPSSALRARLAMVFDGRMIDTDFESLHVSNKYDAIVMNPPFGSGGKTAIDHLAKAITHLRDGGRVVALIPTGPAADKKFDKWFYEESTKPVKPLFTNPELGEVFKGDTLNVVGYEGTNWTIKKVSEGFVDLVSGGTGITEATNSRRLVGLNKDGKRTESYNAVEGFELVASIRLPQVTFERAGTAVATRIVVIEKATNTKQMVRLDYSGETNINELFDRMESLSIAPRAKVVAEEVVTQTVKAKEKEAAKTREADAVASGLVATDGQEVTFAIQDGKLITNAPTEKVITNSGKVLEGVFVPTGALTYPEIKAVDRFTYSPKGKAAGLFVRLEHIVRPGTDAPKFSRTTQPITNPHTPQSAEAAMLDAHTGTDRKALQALLDSGKARVITAQQAQHVTGERLNMVAWHGSPHDHDGFDSSKIGTGEGAQAYGHGLYFAGKKGVAEYYRDALSNVNNDSVISESDFYTILQDPDFPVEYAAQDMLRDKITNAKEEGDDGITWRDVAHVIDSYGGKGDAYIADIGNRYYFDVQPKTGRLYQVELAPAEDEYLLWDRPLSEQSEKVQAALNIYPETWTGEKVYNYIAADRDPLKMDGLSRQRSVNDGSKFASKELHAAGVRGIKYLDGSSRMAIHRISSDAFDVVDSKNNIVARDFSTRKEAQEFIEEKGDFNYVIFDDKDVSITAKYSKDGRALAFFNQKEGITYFIADNIPQGYTAAEWRGLVKHEIGVHAYQLGKDSAEFRDIMKQVESMNRAGNKAVRAAFNRVPDGTAAENVTEEAIGYLVQDAKDLPVVQRIVAWLRNAIRSIGKRMPVMQRARFFEWAAKLTENDILYMAQTAMAKSVETETQREGSGVLASQQNAAFYSQLRKVVRDAPDKVFSTGKQLDLWLQANAGKLGIKKDELFWTGVNDWLKTQDRVSKADVLAYLNGNGVQLQETMMGEAEGVKRSVSIGEAKRLLATEGNNVKITNQYGGRIRPDRADMMSENQEYFAAEVSGETKFARYQLPGGENYRELLLTLPVNEKQIDGLTVDGVAKALGYSGWHDSLTSEEKAHVNRVFDAQKNRPNTGNETRPNTFKSSHYEQPNILAHIRFNERTDAEGNKVLFIEEIQSDFGQTGKKKGFADIDTTGWTAKVGSKGDKADIYTVFDASGKRLNGSPIATSEQEAIQKQKDIMEEGRVPLAPFVTDTKSWTALALKRMITYAAENGFDKVAWTTGEQQSARYDLSKQVKHIDWEKNDDGTYNINAPAVNGDVIYKEDLSVSELEDTLGKDVTKKIIDEIGDKQPKDGYRDWTRLSGDNLSVGNQGMKGYYDQIVPQVANDILKRIGGGKVENLKIGIRPKVEYKSGEAIVTYQDGRTERYDTTKTANDVADAYIEYNAQPSITITPELRAKILGEGMPLFSREKTIGDTGRTRTPEQLAAFMNVGRTLQVPTLKQRAEGLWKDAGKKLAQGMVDQFRPIRDLSFEAYALMRLSKGASGAFEVMLKGGQLKLQDGVYDFDPAKRGGVIDRLLTPLQGEADDFFWWVAANRAEQLSAQDREHLFTPQDIAAMKSLADGKTGYDYTLQHGPNKGKSTRDRAEVYADSLKTFNEFHKNTLDMAEQSGLIDGDARKHWESEFYVPFYRVEEDEGGVRGMNIKSGVTRQQAFKQLKGGAGKLNADLLENSLMNWAHLLDAAAKNRAAKASLEAAARVNVASEVPEGTKKAVWFMDKGQKRHFTIEDPLVMDALSALEFAGMRSPLMNAMGAMKHALTIGVTASPFFKVRNLIRDSVHSIAVSGLNYNVADNLKEGWKLTNPNSDAYFRLLAGGGTIHFGTMFEGSESRRVRSLVEAGVDESTILDSESKYKAFYKRVIEPSITAYNELGNRGEAVNRASLYDQLIKQGKSHAEASLMARDLMDFSMQGSWTSIRFLTQTVPFLNARLQGLYKLGRSTSDDPRKLGIVLGAVAMASIALMLAYSDDEDWKKREDYDRDGFWWFKIGGEAFRIPKPFEIGSLASLAERGVELFTSDEMTGDRFMERFKHLLMDNLAMNPIPQVVKPMLDIYANKDSFTGRPIESMGMEHLDPEYRFTQRTSMAARATSTGTGGAMSPVQIDHLIRGYFGWLGTFIVGSADVIAKPASGQMQGASTDWMKTATGGIIAGVEDAPSRYVTQMYEQAREVEQAHGTWKYLQKTDPAAAIEYRQDNIELLRQNHLVAAVKRSEAALNLRIRMIERSEKSPDEKRMLIRAINAQKELIAKRVSVPRP